MKKAMETLIFTIIPVLAILSFWIAIAVLVEIYL
jgi:hypothetical protein